MAGTRSDARKRLDEERDAAQAMPLSRVATVGDVLGIHGGARVLVRLLTDAPHWIRGTLEGYVCSPDGHVQAVRLRTNDFVPVRVIPWTSIAYMKEAK